MATDLIRFPFQIAPGGSVYTQTDGTDEYYASELAFLVSVRPGERIVVPTYGVDDPLFDNFPTTSLVNAVEVFGPPVEITNVDVQRSRNNPNDVQVTVQFQSESSDSLTPDQQMIGE